MGIWNEGSRKNEQQIDNVYIIIQKDGEGLYLFTVKEICDIAHEFYSDQ